MATYNGTANNDTYKGTNSNDIINGLGGSDNLKGLAGDDTLDGGIGTDTLYGGTGNDTYIYGIGYGNDTIKENDALSGYGGIDQVIFTGLSQSDVTFQKTRNGLDLQITIIATNKILTIRNGFNPDTGYQVESFVFTDGTLTLSQINTKANIGSANSQDLWGTKANDTLDGKGGNDRLYGGDGDDTYVFGTGYGNDTIAENDYFFSNIFSYGGTDQVIFTGLSQSDVQFQKTNDGSDLQATIIATNEKLTISNGFSPDIGNQVESFVFTDGTLTLAQINNQLNIGGVGDDTLLGTDGNDILDGKGGDDTLYGKSGDDTYLFGIGYGNDTIEEYSLIPGFSNSDQVIFTGLTKNAVKFQKINYGKDLLVTIKATNESLSISNAFYLGTFEEVETLIFTDGKLTATQLNTQLNIGGTGNDTLWGTMGNDTLNGKGGNDSLYGGDGDDNYVFGMGYGNDTIAEYDRNALVPLFLYGGNDQVTFTGLTKNAVKFQKADNGLDLLATIIATNETLTIINGLNSYIGFYIESFVFTDGILSLTEIKTPFNIGSANSETLWGTAGNDTLDGKGGNDTLYGNNGDDTYIFGIGYGNDIVSEFDIHAADFPTGGNDQIIFTGLSQSAFKFQKINNGFDLKVTIIATKETLTIYKGFYLDSEFQIESLVFNDGTLTLAQINSQLNIGGSGNDTLWGSTSNDTLDGKGGNDTMYGSGGNDTYIYGIGYGNDTILEFSGTDQVTFTGLSQSAVKFQKTNYGKDLTATIIGSNKTLTILNSFYPDTSYQVEGFVFTDGTLTLSQINAQTNIGGAGDEILWGTMANDTLEGKGGNDSLYGGSGDDTYVFGNGFGIDFIAESEPNYNLISFGGTDKVIFTNYNLSDLSGFTQNNTSLVITFSKNDQVTVQNQLPINSSFNMESFQFANGDIITKLVFGSSTINDILTGTANNDALNGLAGADKMAGGMGNDLYVVDNSGDVVTEAVGAGMDTVLSSISHTLAANTENLVLAGTNAINGTGNSLDNHLTGNNGNNNLYGKAGADVMVGGKGNDTYSVENIGDSIIELSNEGTDKVTSSITWTLGANLENLSLSGIQAINGIGNGLNNIINGTAAANALFGDAGADSLTGGNGRDTLVGGIGKDQLYLAETVAVTDTVKITTGDSKWNGYDEVANFALGKGTTNTTADRLDLDTIKIAANTTAINGVDKGIIKSHSISNGLITFDDVDSFTANLVLSASNLTDVFGYLQNNIKSGNTVAFNALGNTYVFQDGGLIDTVVQLTGVTASNINTTGLVADGVWLV